MDDIQMNRVRTAAEDAMEVFWSSMAKLFPEVETGDFPYDGEAKVIHGLLEAGALWVELNTTKEG